jgi:hypothetical protein
MTLSEDEIRRFRDAEAIDLANGLADDPDRFRLYGIPSENGDRPRPAPTIVTVEEFAATEEDGAEAIIGSPGSILIPEGGDVMFYGDGGAGKTTLCIDAAFHLASGTDWLGMPVRQPVRVLLIESEGPRPLFRQKLRRKLDGWQGAPIDGRVTVFEQPWAQFTFATEDWRDLLAYTVSEYEIDVLVAGPLVRLGMDTAGTLQEVRAFMEFVTDVRTRCGRLLATVLVHHENKGGAVSGAWEGAGDTLLHIQGAGNGHTVMFVQKARWDSERHGKTMHLAWAEGDGFRLEADRDYLADVLDLLADGEWRTVKEIRDAIGAGEKAIKDVLAGNPDRFDQRTGDDAKAVGRHPSATVWQVHQAQNAPDAPSASPGGAEERCIGAFPLRDAPTPDAPHPTSPKVHQPPNAPRTADELQALVDQESAA